MKGVVILEVKINKEIRDYKESMFFGLSLRQTFFSALACIIAVFAYFSLRDYMHIELVSWVCILVAFPLAMLGFITYHGMHFEKIVWVLIKHYILVPSRLLYKPEILYYELMKSNILKHQKENLKHD